MIYLRLNLYMDEWGKREKQNISHPFIDEELWRFKSRRLAVNLMLASILSIIFLHSHFLVFILWVRRDGKCSALHFQLTALLFPTKRCEFCTWQQQLLDSRNYRSEFIDCLQKDSFIHWMWLFTKSQTHSHLISSV